jgi:hypothetical protein
MIQIDDFIYFLKQFFNDSIVNIDDFKDDLKFIEIDCFPNKSYLLVMEVSNDSIKIDKISKAPQLDFSLYKFSFDNIEDAKKLCYEIKAKGGFE